MGVFGQLKNKKKTEKQRKTMKWRRGQRALAKQKHQPQLNIEDFQLFSKDMLKNKMKNMKNNVNLSNKKKNRLLKRLRHGKREQDCLQADTDETMTEVNPKASRKSGKVKAAASETVQPSTSTSIEVAEDMDMLEEGE